jgi:purine-binding chemotaxis protein CheW
MSQVSESAEGPTSRWVTFQLENETYGIDVMQIREVLRSQELSPVPGAPAYVLGIINLRGSVVAIIDARTRFGLPRREEMDEASRILIMDSGNLLVGFLVDSVSEVADLYNDQIDSPPDTGSHQGSRFISGLYNHQRGLLILLDGSKLLSEEEVAEVSSI